MLSKSSLKIFFQVVFYTLCTVRLNYHNKFIFKRLNIKCSFISWHDTFRYLTVYRSNAVSAVKIFMRGPFSYGFLYPYNVRNLLLWSFNVIEFTKSIGYPTYFVNDKLIACFEVKLYRFFVNVISSGRVAVTGRLFFYR